MASSKALAMVKQNSSGSINNAGPTSSNGSSSTSIHSHGRESRASSKDSNLGTQQNPAAGKNHVFNPELQFFGIKYL